MNDYKNEMGCPQMMNKQNELHKLMSNYEQYVRDISIAFMFSTF